MKTMLAPIAFVLLLCGCVGARPVIPDPSIPHQVAESTAVWIWAKSESGRFVKVRAELHAGDWIASDQVVSP